MTNPIYRLGIINPRHAKWMISLLEKDRSLKEISNISGMNYIHLCNTTQPLAKEGFMIRKRRKKSNEYDLSLTVRGKEFIIALQKAMGLAEQINESINEIKTEEVEKIETTE